MVDAWRGARRRVDYRVAPWQTSGLYALVFVLCSGVVLPLTIGYVRAHQVESFRIPSASMTPGIRRGDFLFADKRYNCPSCRLSVRRGDVAIFTYPNDRTLYYIKRIIGLPGDRVRISGHDLQVNGVILTRRQDPEVDGLVTEGAGDRSWQVTWGTSAEAPIDVTVPPGQVFVLGDNRGHAVDSRRFGAVPLQDVVGRARQVWFSYGDGAVRWERLGEVVH